METIWLDKEKLIEQLVAYGYFFEELPDCFSSKGFAQIACSLSSKISKSKTCTSPITISIHKNDNARREMSIPNPEAFLNLVFYIHKNWEFIKEITFSENSLSPITFIHSYQQNQREYINNVKVRKQYHLPSGYKESVKENIKKAMGYKYRLTVDISNFYDSIYTHSLTWAACGKKEAKRIFANQKNKEQFSKEVEDKYNVADKLDKLVSKLKNNQTNGIITGPFTSRIVSEIILSALDKQLRDNNYVFSRYVDDYWFYFRTETAALECANKIHNLFSEFGLRLNDNKTNISVYPYEEPHFFNMEYKMVYDAEGAVGVLQYANKQKIKGIKGSYKYALLFLNKKQIRVDDFDIIIALLVNILLVDPQCGNLVINFLLNNKSRIHAERLQNIINNELEKAMQEGYEFEALLFVYVIRELHINITPENIINVIDSCNDLATIIVLDILKSNKQYINEAINAALERLRDSLYDESYQGFRWLLLYEADRLNLLESVGYEAIEKPPFFTSLYNKNIPFYNSINVEKS